MWCVMLKLMMMMTGDDPVSICQLTVYCFISFLSPLFFSRFFNFLLLFYCADWSSKNRGQIFFLLLLALLFFRLFSSSPSSPLSSRFKLSHYYLDWWHESLVCKPRCQLLLLLLLHSHSIEFYVHLFLLVSLCQMLHVLVLDVHKNWLKCLLPLSLSLSLSLLTFSLPFPLIEICYYSLYSSMSPCTNTKAQKHTKHIHEFNIYFISLLESIYFTQ